MSKRTVPQSVGSASPKRSKKKATPKARRKAQPKRSPKGPRGKKKTARQAAKARPDKRADASDASDAGNRNSSTQRKSQADRLVQLAAEAKLFRAPGEQAEGYASIQVGGHGETYPIESRPFRGWLRKRFWGQYGKTPHKNALESALGVISGQAAFSGPQIPVAVRLADHNGAIYLDLADDKWRGVKITRDGWQVVSRPPVKFIRKAGMLALPEPVSGGNVDELRRFVNVPNDDDWVLVVAWLLAALRPAGPYPILVLGGEQGSAKSSAARILRSVIDPNTAPVRAAPRNVHDLIIASSNSWCVNLDNLSYLAIWLSDALCRLSTGGGFSTRQLYTNDDEALFDVQKPVIVNGIEDFVTRADLMDRCIPIRLPEIRDNYRRTEDEIYRKFEAARPRILGGLLDAVCHGLRMLPKVRLDSLPRLADFAKWIAACEGGLKWPRATFMEAFEANRKAATRRMLAESLVAEAVRSFMDKNDRWEGTATELLVRLNNSFGDSLHWNRGWPKAPHVLSSKLRRVAPGLRSIGIEVTFVPHGGDDRGRLIVLENTRKQASQASAASGAGKQGSGTQER